MSFQTNPLWSIEESVRLDTRCGNGVKEGDVKKILRAFLVVMIAVAALIAWALWYYRPTLEQTHRSDQRSEVNIHRQ